MMTAQGSFGVFLLIKITADSCYAACCYILYKLFVTIPTRSLQNNLNSICLSVLARSISIICIVNKIQAIKNSVAGLLPRYKIIIAEARNKINTLKR